MRPPGSAHPCLQVRDPGERACRPGGRTVERERRGLWRGMGRKRREKRRNERDGGMKGKEMVNGERESKKWQYWGM